MCIIIEACETVYGAYSKYKLSIEVMCIMMVEKLTRSFCQKNTAVGKEPSLAANGRLTTYWRTSSSFLKLNNLRILDARFGPRRLGIVVSVSPGISCSPAQQKHISNKFYTMTSLAGMKTASNTACGNKTWSKCLYAMTKKIFFPHFMAKTAVLCFEPPLGAWGQHTMIILGSLEST